MVLSEFRLIKRNTEGGRTVADEAYIVNLVKKVQKSDNDAFAELYTMTYSKQYSYSRRYLRDEQYAQDAVQEVYILAFKNIKKLKEPKYFQTWLTKINFRVCYDMSVKRSKSYAESSEILEIVPDEDISSNPEELFMRDSENQQLKDALASLPVKERDAIVLKYSAKMSLQDIADSLDCSISSVTRYLNRGYRGLREKLGGK